MILRLGPFGMRTEENSYYRETMVVMDLGWVDLTLEYSTILLGSS